MFMENRKDLSEHYQPICMIPVVVKFFERIINPAVIIHLEANNLCYSSQREL